MYTYFATFPAGMFELIARQLKRFALSELKILEHDDSSLVFEASLTVERLIELRFFTNVFLVVDDVKNTPRQALRGSNYRLMLLKNGAPQPLPATERAHLEAGLKKLRLEPDARASRNDFYVIERASGKKLLGLRLARAKFKRDKRPDGELRPELAHLLCLAAGIKAKHVVLDPFAGYGAIPYEAVRGFGCKRVIAVDQRKLGNRHDHQAIHWHEGDARQLDFVADRSVDRVVTDPPWGAYDKSSDLGDTYNKALHEIARVLKPAGVAVILCGSDALDQAIQQARGFTLLKSYSILVSGKKARVVKLQKG
jgi:16S rRNA G966 N2-methylase RsmD